VTVDNYDSQLVRAEATPSRTIGDLQDMQNNAISELDEVVHTLGSKIDPVRVRREMKLPSISDEVAGISGDTSPVGAEIAGQTARIMDITRYVRGVLSEIEF
jgi:hypothetical protein